MDWLPTEASRAQAGNALPGERRRSLRGPARGLVEISFDDAVAVTIVAKLVDANSDGFRAAHESRRLTPGMEVRYRFSGEAGRARVVWTHSIGGQRASGFVRIPGGRGKWNLRNYGNHGGDGPGAQPPVAGYTR